MNRVLLVNIKTRAAELSIQMVLIGLIIFISFVPSFVKAEFLLNFSPALATPGGNCSVVGGDCTVKGGNYPNGGTDTTGYGNDGTRFIQEKLFRNNDYYFHVVVGDPAQGFANEFYVAANNLVASTINDQSVPLDGGARSSSVNSGGNERLVIGNHDVFDTRGELSGSDRLFGNGKDPFGVTVDPTSVYKAYDLSGNGTEDPRKVIMRLVLSDANISLEVIKPLLNRKPRISQLTKDSVMSSQFIADMRGISYDEMSREAPITNRMVLNDASMPQQGAADFDMSQTQRSNVTAGQFIFTAGQGWLSPQQELVDPDGDGLFEYVYSRDQNNNFIWVQNPKGWDVDYSKFDEGTYTYADGDGFNVYGIRWASFFDYDQNKSCGSAATGGTGNRVRAVCPQ